jgi:hypothetical protein
MAMFIKKITGGFTPSAKVIDGTLILSLPDAISPVVWRMELGHAKSSAIEVREQKDGGFMLTLKTPKGDVNDIAPYATRAAAVTALVAISNALEHAHGHINPGVTASDVPAAPRAANTNTHAKGSRARGILTGIIGLAVVIMLIGVLMSMSPMPASINPAGGPAGSIAGNGGTSGIAEMESAFSKDVPAGQSMSAEDFLRNR